MKLTRLEAPDALAYRHLGMISRNEKWLHANDAWDLARKGEADLYRVTGDGCIGTVALCIDAGQLLIYQAAGEDAEGRFCEKFKPVIKQFARELGITEIRAHTKRRALARLYRRLFDKMRHERGEYIFEARAA